MEELNLQTIVDQYISSMQLKGQAGKTIREKRYTLNSFAAYVAARPLTSQLSFKYITYLKTKKDHPYKVTSANNVITHLKTLEKWMLKIGYCKEAWTLLLERSKVEVLKNFVYAHPDLIEKAIIAGTEPQPFIFGISGDNVINAFRKLETRFCLRFISRKGLRIEEALRLRWSDFNFDAPAAEFRIAPIKGHKEVWMEIPADMVEELRIRKSKNIDNFIKDPKDRDRVFITTERLCNEAIQRGWLSTGLKGDVCNHFLRHQHAAHLLKNGVPMEMVKVEMRHKSIKITIDTYGHLLNSDSDPLVQAADPRTRRALDYKRQSDYVRGKLDAMNLDSETVGIEITVKDGEFTFRMYDKVACR